MKNKIIDIINEKYPKLSEWYDPYTSSILIEMEVDERIDPMIEFNRLKEEYQGELLRFLKEFGLKMVNGKFDLNNETHKYYYFEDLGEECDDVYAFGVGCMMDNFNHNYTMAHNEVLSHQINKEYLGLK